MFENSTRHMDRKHCCLSFKKVQGGSIIKIRRSKEPFFKVPLNTYYYGHICICFIGGIGVEKVYRSSCKFSKPFKI